MDVVSGIARLTPAQGRLFVAIGVFDGHHRGHRHLLRILRREAARRAARPAVITFDHHPDEVIRGAAPALLCDPAERLRLLAEAGVEVVVVEHFDAALRTTPYDAFIAAIAARVDLAGFLMTPDAAFGHERAGTPQAVAQLGRTTGFELVVAPVLELDGRPVRSSLIRTALAAGQLHEARRLLGRAVEVIGDAVASDDRTVLVHFDLPVALPPDGRYRALMGPELARGQACVRAVASLDGGQLWLRCPKGRAPAGRVRVRLQAALD